MQTLQRAVYDISLDINLRYLNKVRNKRVKSEVAQMKDPAAGILRSPPSKYINLQSKTFFIIFF